MKFRWLMVPLVAGAAYYALFGGEYSLFEARKLEKERAREEQRLAETRREVSGLRARRLAATRYCHARADRTREIRPHQGG